MKKIGIVLTNITNGAGTERAVSNLVTILDNLNYQSVIISVDSVHGECKFKIPKSTKIIHLGLNVSSKCVFKKLHSYFLLPHSIKRIIHQENLDCLCGTHVIYNTIINFMDVKRISCEHFNYESSNILQKFLRYISYRKSNAIVVLTERDKKNYKKYKNVYVIPNSLPFHPHEKSSCDNKSIISVGRLTEQKGFDILIECARELKVCAPDWKIVIYGEGEEKEKLTNMIKRYDVEDYVSINNYVANIEQKYISSGIYVSTARWEGFSLVVLEAQACGLPAVVFDCPSGPAEIVEDGKTGYVIDLGNCNMFIEKIMTLITNSEVRKKMGALAAKEAKRFDESEIEKKWQKLLENVI